MTAKDADRKGFDLSTLSYWEAVEFLREQATILDYTSLDRQSNALLDISTVGIVLRLFIPSRTGELEKVILSTTVWTDKPRMREAYSISEFEWMVVEVNALWRRKHRTLNMKSKRILFFVVFAIGTWLTSSNLHGTDNKTYVLCMTL